MDRHRVRANDRSRRGAALLIVLVFGAILSGLAAVASRSSVSGARAAAVFARVMQADDYGRSVGPLVVAYLQEGPPERRRGGSFVTHLPGAEMAVEYVSESARVDANSAPPELIAAVLRAAGAEPVGIDAVAGRIAALRAAAQPGGSNGAAARPGSAAPAAASGNGAPSAVETATFRAGGDTPSSPSAPAAQSGPGTTPPAIQSVADVARAWGLDPSLARRVLPALTVASRSAQVDPIIAPKLVVEALFAGDTDRADDFRNRRQEGFADANSALLLLPAASKGFATFDDVPTLRAVARVSLVDGPTRRYEAVIEPPDGAGHPPRVLSWRPLF